MHSVFILPVCIMIFKYGHTPVKPLMVVYYCVEQWISLQIIVKKASSCVQPSVITATTTLYNSAITVARNPCKVNVALINVQIFMQMATLHWAM